MSVGVVGVVIDTEGVQQLPREDLDLSSVETDLKDLLSVLENATEESKSYSIDEVKLTIGVSKDKEGKLKAGLWAQMATVFKVGAEVELANASNTNRLIELTIKRK